MPASQRRSASRRARREPNPWLRIAWLSVALAITAVLWWFAKQLSGPPPLDDIDAASRRQLESVLRKEEPPAP